MGGPGSSRGNGVKREKAGDRRRIAEGGEDWRRDGSRGLGREWNGRNTMIKVVDNRRGLNVDGSSVIVPVSEYLKNRWHGSREEHQRRHHPTQTRNPPTAHGYQSTEV